ncbi:MAG: VOC family protein [Gammaproteobacteria bacterium]|nr:VOC family protein [Gammaproteobacteria bacterium]
MMQSKISHIQFNVQAANLPFYKDLLAFAGLQTLYDGEEMLGVGDDNETSLWFSGSVRDVLNNYDGPGMNHLALEVPAQSDVDAAVAWLAERGVPALFGTPRHNPEFSSAERTYYQVMFESPDRILFEIVYMGPKAD